MQEADAEDKKQSNTKSQRVKLRKYICEAVAAIRPKRVGQPHNCFLKIEDEENALSYKTILEYMDTKFNLVEVDRSSAEAYLKEVHDGDGKYEITPDMEVVGST